MSIEYDPYPKGFIHPGSWHFSIGYYIDKTGLLVNLECGKPGDEGFKIFHIHDLGSWIPKFIRIGLYATKLRKEAEDYYSERFPDWEPYLRGRGTQPLLEFEKRLNIRIPKLDSV